MNLGPYHWARFNAIAAQGINLKVVATPIPEFYRPWNVDTSPEASPVEVLTPFGFDHGVALRSIFSSVYDFLQEQNPKAVICIGYNSKYIWAFTWWCKRLGIPVILHLDGWSKGRCKVFLKEWLKMLYCRFFFDAALVTGSSALNYALKLGIEESMIWKTGNVIDNAHFAHCKILRLPDGYSLPSRFFLSVSRLSPEKNIDGLLLAFEQYCQRGGLWDLCIVGTGPEESILKDSVPKTLEQRVHWLGWRSYHELPFIYQCASCLVLPSRIEPWGLVVNEAMAAGLPVLVSRACGCLPELCLRGINGYDFDPDDTDTLSNLLMKVSSGDVDLKAMGEASRQIVSRFNLRNYARCIDDCVKTLGGRKVHP